LFQVGGPKGGGLPELAQRGLRRDNTVTENRSVGGSIPPLGTIFLNKINTINRPSLPPKNAIVLCVDEKPSIQALERAQGYLKLPNGRALTGQSHDYKRHGTTTLFAAFEVATGKVRAAHKKRRRRKEFLDFMDDIVAAYPKARLRVILDNLNTHQNNDE
jgi:hypothetical protein